MRASTCSVEPDTGWIPARTEHQNQGGRVTRRGLVLALRASVQSRWLAGPMSWGEGMGSQHQSAPRASSFLL